MSGSPSLVSGYRGVVCDLDGVVYRGAEAVTYAVDSLDALDIPVVYATNNASRTPGDVAAHLGRLGMTVSAAGVVTSSTAAAAVLAQSLPAGTPVLAVGGGGVAEALRGAGLDPVSPADHRDGAQVRAVLQGYGADVTAADLAEAAYAIASGARWVATNEDQTLPTDRGVVPGNGALVGAVRAAAGVDPEVTGKPHAPMYAIAAQVMGVPVEAVLAVGDRLETDIAGAVTTGMDGLLVLTGVHGWADAAAAPVEARPTYVVADLRSLAEGYPRADREGQWWLRGRARATVHGAQLVVEGSGADARRAALDALWAAVDHGDLDALTARSEMERLVTR